MEQRLLDLAARLGFVTAPCASCDPIIDPECGNCEGAGFVWHGSSGTTLAQSGLRRLVALVRDSAKVVLLVAPAIA